jgi:hypothetical protein
MQSNTLLFFSLTKIGPNTNPLDAALYSEQAKIIFSENKPTVRTTLRDDLGTLKWQEKSSTIC